jgi:hypothetical protein
VRVAGHGFASVVDSLDRPTSLEFIGNAAFVVKLTGKAIRIDHVAGSRLLTRALQTDPGLAADARDHL